MVVGGVIEPGGVGLVSGGTAAKVVGGAVGPAGVGLASGGGIAAKERGAGSGSDGSLTNHPLNSSVSVTVGKACSERSVVLSPSSSSFGGFALCWLVFDALVLDEAVFEEGVFKEALFEEAVFEEFDEVVFDEVVFDELVFDELVFRLALCRLLSRWLDSSSRLSARSRSRSSSFA